jgi:cytochrome oxidase assembly protein ShyY1
MVGLGLWQLDAYDERQSADALARQQERPTPLGRILGPDSAFPSDGVGRPVMVTGRYVADEQIYVRGLPGSTGRYAATTPLLTPTGSLILVVRGSTDELGGVPPGGVVTVSGLLEPSAGSGSPLSSQRVTDGLRIAGMLDGFSRDLYAGYIVLTDSRPDDPLSPVEPPLSEPSPWAGFRNLLYAVQWWVFAGFVVFMWWRIVRDGDSPGPGDDPADRADAGAPGVGVRDGDTDTVQTSGVG